MKLNPEYSTNEGRKQTIAHDADGRPYIKVISAFGVATAYDMGGNLVGRWEASKEEIDEYNNAPEYTEEPAQTEGKEEEKKMLRSNSKQARENIRAYIVDHFDGTNYAPDFDYIEQAQKDNENGSRNVDIFSMVAHAIASTFYDEMCHFDNRFKAGRVSRYELFEDWCAGLPSILDTCYYYNRSAVDDLGNILQENDAEKAKYTEQKAEKRLTQLIYREIYSVKWIS